MKQATPLGNYPTQSFTPSGTAKLTALNTFLVGHKLTSGAVDIPSWRVAD